MFKTEVNHRYARLGLLILATAFSLSEWPRGLNAQEYEVFEFASRAADDSARHLKTCIDSKLREGKDVRCEATEVVDDVLVRKTVTVISDRSASELENSGDLANVEIIYEQESECLDGSCYDSEPVHGYRRYNLSDLREVGRLALIEVKKAEAIELARKERQKKIENCEMDEQGDPLDSPGLQMECRVQRLSEMSSQMKQKAYYDKYIRHQLRDWLDSEDPSDLSVAGAAIQTLSGLNNPYINQSIRDYSRVLQYRTTQERALQAKQSLNAYLQRLPPAQRAQLQASPHFSYRFQQIRQAEDYLRREGQYLASRGFRVPTYSNDPLANGPTNMNPLLQEQPQFVTPSFSQNQTPSVSNQPATPFPQPAPNAATRAGVNIPQMAGRTTNPTANRAPLGRGQIPQLGQTRR